MQTSALGSPSRSPRILPVATKDLVLVLVAPAMEQLDVSARLQIKLEAVDMSLMALDRELEVGQVAPVGRPARFATRFARRDNIWTGATLTSISAATQGKSLDLSLIHI